MIPAFSYSRVSSREQEREGYSIPAQRKLLTEYGRLHGYAAREFIDVESAKNPGRKQFCVRCCGCLNPAAPVEPSW
jgi:site-specific DNA recombinase